MTISEKIIELKDIFDLFDDSKDKYMQIIDMGKKSSGLRPEERIETHKIYGCTSQAWVVIYQEGKNTFSVQTDSDALIVKGLLSIIENICKGETSENINDIDGNNLLNAIGLYGSISSQRTNGISAALEKIKKDIKWMEKKK
jgi:cysteine desulfuration protein SufE